MTRPRNMFLWLYHKSAWLPFVPRFITFSWRPVEGAGVRGIHDATVQHPPGHDEADATRNRRFDERQGEAK